jgi:hypothetical protein
VVDVKAEPLPDGSNDENEDAATVVTGLHTQEAEATAVAVTAVPDGKKVLVEADPETTLVAAAEPETAEPEADPMKVLVAADPEADPMNVLVAADPDAVTADDALTTDVTACGAGAATAAATKSERTANLLNMI